MVDALARSTRSVILNTDAGLASRQDVGAELDMELASAADRRSPAGEL